MIAAFEIAVGKKINAICQVPILPAPQGDMSLLKNAQMNSSGTLLNGRKFNIVSI